MRETVRSSRWISKTNCNSVMRVRRLLVAIGQRPLKPPGAGANDVHSVNLFAGDQLAELITILRGHLAGGMIGKSGENGDVVSVGSPVARQLRSARGGRSHFRRKILRDVKNFHEILVVAELEGAFVAERPRAPAAALRVCFPAVGVVGKNFVAGKTVHHPQLHDM